MKSCKALTTPDTMWNFCPSLAASILFLVLFALTTLAHLAQAVYHRRPYCWVIVMSGALQVVTYVFRTVSILTPASFGDYAAWFVLILIAPLWTNAFVYMVFGRAVWSYRDDGRVWGLSARLFGIVFVALDIVALIIQVLGAVQAAQQHAPQHKVLLGLHVYMGGVGLQQLFILVFCLFSIKMFVDLRKGLGGKGEGPKAQLLLVVLLTALALITLRIVFRLGEYSQGLDSSIPRHEAFQYCLDSLPMLIALVLFNIIHPGRLMPRTDNEMPSVFRWGKKRGRPTQPGFALDSISNRSVEARAAGQQQ
ncbi:hypothetical protein VTK73DRAFT_6731 [Phialemonium thermophilum]|uniref:Uncharacterized protein n=1 Tax=Phialemonium thermophilum TaxID=223376 RepID=A0ABR3WI83_9PEZI